MKRFKPRIQLRRLLRHGYEGQGEVGGEVGSVVKNDPARISVDIKLRDLGWIRNYPGFDSTKGPKD
jgi:hypothetical protein